MLSIELPIELPIELSVLLVFSLNCYWGAIWLYSHLCIHMVWFRLGLGSRGRGAGRDGPGDVGLIWLESESTSRYQEGAMP